MLHAADAFMFVLCLFNLTLRQQGRKDRDMMGWQTSFSCNLFLGREGCHGNRQQGSEMLGCGGRVEREVWLFTVNKSSLALYPGELHLNFRFL